LLATLIDALVYLSNDKVCSEGTNPLKELEEKLIARSRQYYRIQAEKWVQTCDLASFLQLAEKVLNEDKVRFRTYLTWNQIESKLTAEFNNEILMRF